LFEAHTFHILTDGTYDRAHPNISSPVWDRTLYGAAGSHQYDRLNEAIPLNREAALESASWGKFQIMGSNHALCGYSDVESFVTAMMADEANHLSAFGNFCNVSGITRFLIAHDWAHFALRYNGPGNVSNYAGKLASAYQRRLATQPSTPANAPLTVLKFGDSGPAVAELQHRLTIAGYALSVDGFFGTVTEAAVKNFQSSQSGRLANLLVDGVAGPATLTALYLLITGLST
jgi:hypothetical protein